MSDWLFATPWTVASQASLSFVISWNLFKLMSIELVMPSNHVILSRPLLLLPSILPSILYFLLGLPYWNSAFTSISFQGSFIHIYILTFCVLVWDNFSHCHLNHKFPLQLCPAYSLCQLSLLQWCYLLVRFLSGFYITCFFMFLFCNFISIQGCDWINFLELLKHSHFKMSDHSILLILYSGNTCSSKWFWHILKF